MFKKIKNGFTLVELLAVIGILAIIIMIAVPIILNVIQKSKDDVFESNVKLIIKAVEIKRGINEDYDLSNLNVGNIQDELGISADNLSYLEIQDIGGEIVIHAIGDNTWDGLEAQGPSNNLIITKGSSGPTEVYTVDNSGASEPVLPSNMIAVRWNGSNWAKADTSNPTTSNQWYNYDEQKWANAVTVTSASRGAYLSSSFGTVINMSDILTFFVWVPRYKYAVPTGAGPRTINVVFENSATTKSTGNAIGTNYLTHPAFTFGSDELEGVWVAKFTSTGAIDNVTVLPNNTMLRNYNVSTFYNATRSMQNAANIYGFATTGVDVHMMKNMEWGAVAYLSHSNYGINGEIYVNNHLNYLTGCSADNPSDLAVDACQNEYNTAGGFNASTTGNIYGIYDMSGGAWEWVMGNHSNAGLSSGWTNLQVASIAAQYITRYTGTLGHKGDATNNDGTSGWYGDMSDFPTATLAWIMRGGNRNSGVQAGIFNYDMFTGTAWSAMSFRVVVVKS